MDVLNHTQSSDYLNLVEESKTGLETTATQKDTDTSWLSGATTLLSKGLDLGIALTKPKEPIPSPEKPEEKIMGIKKPIFYGSLAIVGLVAAVIIVKKMKK